MRASERRISRSALLKAAFYLFLVAMGLHGSFPLFNNYVATAGHHHRLISLLDSENVEVGSFSNVAWDEFTYLPRMNNAALGRVFSDPWNSHNPSFTGWGTFGLIPPLLAGAFIYVFDHPYLSLGIWALLNFSFLALIFIRLFMASPIGFPRPAAILMTFVVVSFTWLGSWRLDWLSMELLTNVFIRGNFVSAETDIEAGLLTHVFYALFLLCYWRFIAEKSRQWAMIMGAAAGLLTYVYFFHFIFAFSMIASYIAVTAWLRDSRSLRSGLVALMVGLIVAVPYLINSIIFVIETAGVLYQERLSYSPGRNPFQDYPFFAHLALPGILAVFYVWLRPASEIKTAVIRTLLVLGLAYALVLHVRVVLGYMQAEDHFWRQSLGMPATVWSVIAAADLIRSRLSEWGLGRNVVLAMALLLPALVLARTGVKAAYQFNPSDSKPQVSQKQIAIVSKLDCIEKVLMPGEGFLSDDPALNYHVMANLKGRPFVPMGLSPMSVEGLTTRYLLASYLLGRDDVAYPSARRTAGYVHTTDPHLYLYVNLFQNPKEQADTEAHVKSLYKTWEPDDVKWKEQQEAFSSVKVAYVPKDRAIASLERLGAVFTVEKTVNCALGDALRLTSKFGIKHPL